MEFLTDLVVFVKEDRQKRHIYFLNRVILWYLGGEAEEYFHVLKKNAQLLYP